MPKDALRYVSFIGGLVTLVELVCYAAFFEYVFRHDNYLAIGIVPASVIQHRNKTNAVSMFGQVLSWFMEVWYILLVGILSTFVKMEFLRGVFVLIKCSEYCLVPMVQILTSAPIRRFWYSRK